MLIGWSSVDVTPTRPVVLRGQFHARISQGVNDPLTATVLALEKHPATSGSHQAIMVSCDRVSCPSAVVERVQRAVAPQIPDFDVSRLFINATHTHTAPEIEEGRYPEQDPSVMTPTEYQDFFADRVSQAVVQAWQSRTEGGVSWGYGHAVVGHNRRISYFNGTSKMYGATNQPDFDSVEGYEDHGVDLAFTWDKHGELTGIIVNLACPSQVSEGEYFVSADFWHEARLEIRRPYGEHVFIMPQCSAAGDQSPHLLLYKRAEENMLRRKGLTQRQEIARRIANAVDDVLPFAKGEIVSAPAFAHVVQTLCLPVRMVTRSEYEAACTEYQRWEQERPDAADVMGTSRRYVMMQRYMRVMKRYETQEQQPACPIDVHIIRVGDVAFATNPFELFLDFGIRIKARSRALQTFVIQLAGTGTNAVSCYLPTAKAVAARSYGAEVTDNVLGPEAGQLLVDRTVEMINALWDDEEPH
jgi:hypothetical protein